MRPPRPYLSVIVPAHQSADMLPKSLAALRASDLPRESWELIVVDDASTDDTALVAARYADTVVQLAGNPYGPAYARNRGCEASRGEILVFVDCDVCVHPDALRRLAVLFGAHPDTTAAFGSYDQNPAVPGFVSRYRNLLHHFVHQMSAGPAETFWAGLGAVRRDAFVEVGMFDEWHYSRPQIEDIELGRRLRRHDYRITLEPDVQGTHLKRWTFRGTLVADYRDRGVPWSWLLLKEGPSAGSNALNLRGVQKWCTALVGGAAVGTASALVFLNPWPLVGAAAAVVAVVISNLGFYRFLRRRRSFRFAVAVIPLQLLYYLSNVLAVVSGWIMLVLLGEPQPSAEAKALSSSRVKTWPPAPSCPPVSVWNRDSGARRHPRRGVPSE